jgi:enoyl-[acyl-carrier protein] reductase II
MTNRIAETLGIQFPIIQAPMLWLTDAKLVAAVSNAGGLGVLGINAGQNSVTRSIDETIARMREQIKAVKALTDRPFGLSFSPTGQPDDPFAEPMFNLMIEEQVPVAVITSMGPVVDNYFKRLHDHQIKIVYRNLTPTVENTRATEAAGADVIVATGFDEGGTIPEKVIGTFAAVPMIADAVQHNTPIMAAGGITDARTAKAAFALGAEGLYVGTAFLMAQESPMAENIKQQVLAANADDLLLYRTQPAYYRSLPGELPNKLAAMDQAGATKDKIAQTSKNSEGMRQGMLFGDLTQGFASFGLGISQIHAIEPAAAIVKRLAAGIA